jgi:DNA (cytosine-5)-methyltransferase 1
VYSDGTVPTLRSGGGRPSFAQTITAFMATMGGNHGSAYSDGTTPGLRGVGSKTPIAVAMTSPQSWCPDVSGPLGGASQSGGFRTTDLDNSGAFIVTAFDTTQITCPTNGSSPRAGATGHPLSATAPPPLQITDQRGHDGHGVAPTLHAKETNNDFAPMLLRDAVVRRLTPRECERLQGFPDDHTLIPWKGKPATDGHRYKALGNSMAVPVMRWIGERIQEEDDRG